MRNNGQDAEGALIDDTNRRLLAELQADARLSLAELGRRVGLSSPAVADRLQRLEQTGVITGYSAGVNPRALGYSLSAVVRIRPAPGQLRNVAELARQTPEVVECQRITGEDCYIMKAHVRDVLHLEEVIDHFVALGQTTTSIVQSSPVPARGLALDAGAA
ncbi:MAG: Lrp/AsnC family transcriptional regulator, leucine-responsive regulatory protein [Thermoleophilaceae bacterium]|nr:Lrp/AsnC family transcriptional regulator, leucine-responsive regulatory protein [Thermoleophilaceae bacterium]